MSSTPTVSYRCPLKWSWGYRDRWRKANPTTGSRALGTWWHTIKEAHYRALQHYQLNTGNATPEPGSPNYMSVKRYVLAMARAELAEVQDPDDRLKLEWMYAGYLEQYDLDQGYKILEIECKDEIQLGHLSDGTEVWIKTRIDLIVENLVDGGIEIWDHKSGRNLSTNLALELDAQFDLYILLKRVQGVKVRQAIRNEARTTMNKGDQPNALADWTAKKARGEKAGAKPVEQTLEQRFQRLPLDRTTAELKYVAQDTLDLVENMYGPHAARITASQNPDTCQWKCDFLDAHLMVRKGEPVEAVLEENGFEQETERTRH